MGPCQKPEPEPSKKPLVKAKSWSPDTQREAVWRRQKRHFRRMQRCRSKSFTDSDVDELRACFELGFGFELDSPDLDPKWSSAFPALEFYCAVNKQYRSYSLAGSSSSPTVSSSDTDTSSLAAGSSSSFLFEPGQIYNLYKQDFLLYYFFNVCFLVKYLKRLFNVNLFVMLCPGDEPEVKKMRLRQWAKVVACSVRHSSPN